MNDRRCGRCGTDMGVHEFIQPNGDIYRGCTRCLLKSASTRLTKAEQEEILKQMLVAKALDS